MKREKKRRRECLCFSELPAFTSCRHVHINSTAQPLIDFSNEFFDTISEWQTRTQVFFILIFYLAEPQTSEGALPFKLL